MERKICIFWFLQKHRMKSGCLNGWTLTVNKIWQHKWPSNVTLCSATRSKGFKTPHKLLVFPFYISSPKRKDQADLPKMAPRNPSEKPALLFLPIIVLKGLFAWLRGWKASKEEMIPQFSWSCMKGLTVVMSIYKYQLLHRAARLLVIVAVW